MISSNTQKSLASYKKTALSIFFFLLAINLHAVTLINGSFEEGPSLSGTYDTLYGGDNTSLTGWTVIGNSINYISSAYWQPEDGNYSLDLSGNAAGGVEQTLTTVVGQKYDVSFWMAGNPSGSPTTKLLNVSETAIAPGARGVNETYAFNVANTSFTDMGWVEKNFDFTASSTETVLAFTSLVNTDSGPALDNVSIETISGAEAVPEPSVTAYFIAGTLALVLLAKRRSLIHAKI